MTKWLKEPVFHFLVLGLLIFVLYGHLADRGSAPGEIFISSGQQQNLINTFARTWQRPPTTAEFKALMDDYLRQEIAYRESQALGLDQDDIIIRRRLRQKLELLAEDVATLAEPSDEQLQAYLDEHAQDFQLDPVLSLRHIYFSPDRRGAAAKNDARELLQVLTSEQLDVDVELSGDPLPLPFELNGMHENEISRMFGSMFTDGLAGLETGAWSGPVESGFGWHLVFIESRQEGRMPSLDEARAEVQRDWFNQRRREAVDGMYERLAENYTVEVETLADEPGEADSRK